MQMGHRLSPGLNQQISYFSSLVGLACEADLSVVEFIVSCKVAYCILIPSMIWEELAKKPRAV
jgi:hypothetical protein